MGRAGRIMGGARRIAREEGFGEFIKRSWNWSLERTLDMLLLLLFLPVPREITLSLSIHKLENRIRQERCLDDILDTAFNFRGYGIYRTIRPIQNREEIRELARVVKKKKPKVVVELGTADGGTLYIWARYLDSVSKLICLDLPRNKFVDNPKYKNPFFSKFADDDDMEMFFVRKNSRDIETKREIERILDGSKIDFLFIDGDHSYEGVMQNFEMYCPLISENGIIAFHDIVYNPYAHTQVCRVDKFWNEIKGSYRYKEIIEDVNQCCNGIGILEWTNPVH